jgi:CBS domain containing-hemolysin-like protein
MTAGLWILAALMAPALTLVSFVQLLYLEALRLRAREQRALEFFKESLEEKLGLKTEHGALSFSVLKHVLLVAIGAVLCALTVSGSALGWARLLEAMLAAFALMLGCAYIIPQTLYRKTEGRWLLPLVPGLRLAALVVRPLVAAFDFFTSVAEIGQREGEVSENGNVTEEFEALIEAGADEGLINEDDRKLIESVVALGEKTAREVMTARPNIVAIHQDATMEDLRRLVVEQNYSRIPVYRDSIDDIVGFIHVRDLLKLDYAMRSRRRVREFLRPVRFVPETKPITQLLREMQRENAHMVIVIDEYGATAGLVTLEDVMEEVFGEIRDEHDEATDVREEAPGVYLMPGEVDLDRLEELFEFRRDEDAESTTVGGLVTEWLGRVPVPGEVIERSGIRLEVLEGDERRVSLVRVSRGAPAEEPEALRTNGRPR